MKQTILALGLAALAAPAIGASTSSQTFPGQPVDPRITACGITIETGRQATIRPFLETATPLSGRYRLEVAKVSQGGSSRSMQANAFSGSDLGNATIAVDWPSGITVALTIEDEAGTVLCTTQVELGPPAI